jgi:hypothetical protein
MSNEIFTTDLRIHVRPGLDHLVILGGGSEDDNISEINDNETGWDLILEVESDESPEPYESALFSAGFEPVRDNDGIIVDGDNGEWLVRRRSNGRGLVVFFPAFDEGSEDAVRAYAAREWNQPEAGIGVRRDREDMIGTAVAADNLLPLDQWSPDMVGRSPYVVVRGVDLME